LDTNILPQEGAFCLYLWEPLTWIHGTQRWVKSYRDHGGVVFIDLRDRDGVTQIVFDLPTGDGSAEKQRYELARALRNEWVIAVGGTVRGRG